LGKTDKLRDETEKLILFKAFGFDQRS